MEAKAEPHAPSSPPPQVLRDPHTGSLQLHSRSHGRWAGDRRNRSRAHARARRRLLLSPWCTPCAGTTACSPRRAAAWAQCHPRQVGLPATCAMPGPSRPHAGPPAALLLHRAPRPRPRPPAPPGPAGWHPLPFGGHAGPCGGSPSSLCPGVPRGLTARCSSSRSPPARLLVLCRLSEPSPPEGTLLGLLWSVLPREEVSGLSSAPAAPGAPAVLTQD